MLSNKRCFICKKKTYTNIKCKCKKIVCLKHNSAHLHSCTFDYKELTQKKLIKENQLINSIKVNNI